jgi:hypothetical protein
MSTAKVINIIHPSGTTTNLVNDNLGSVTIGNNLTVTGSTTSTTVVAPTITGGTTASSSLTLKSTSGVGTSDSILFKVGNNGATTAMAVDTSGNVGIGTAVSYGKLLVYGDAVNFSPSADNTSNGIGACVYGTNVATATSAVAKLYLTGNNAAHAGTLDLRSGSVIGSTINMYNVAGTKTVYFNTNADSYINGGNLGIGTSSPSSKLTVNSNGTQLYLDNSSGGQYTQVSWLNSGTTKANAFWDNNATAFYFGTDVSAPMLFRTNSTEAMRIDSSGNVGIGTSSPGYKLGVNGTIYTSGQSIGGAGFWAQGSFAIATQGAYIQWNTSGSAGETNFVNQKGGGSGGFTWSESDTSNNRTERMRIDTSGNVGIGTASPGRLLSVYGTSDTQIQATSTGVNSYVQATGSSGSAYFGAYGSGFGVLTSATLRMLIDSSGNVGIGTSSPNASAILDAQSTTKGIRFPNMTTTQKNAVSSPATGLVVFDTTLAKLCVYSGSAWQTITSV